MESIDSKVLEGMVRKILNEIIAGNGCRDGAVRHVDPSGILSVKLP